MRMSRGLNRLVSLVACTLVVVALVPVSPAFAATVNGRITSAQTEGPLLGMHVRMWPNGNPADFDEVICDSEGRFYFNGFDAGAWVVWAYDPAGNFNQRYWHESSGSTDFAVSDDSMVGMTIKMAHSNAVATDVYRLSGANRYATAVEIAVENHTDWAGLSHLVVASGEDASAVDALTAGGLAGAYHCPVLLVAKDSLPTIVRDAIAKMPAGIDVTIVGGTSAVSDAVKAAIDAIPSVDQVDRVWGQDRYDTATMVDIRMETVRGMPATGVLIANGENPASFYDAMALSPLSCAQYYPILLTRKDSVPAATAECLFNNHDGVPRYLAGGTAVISETTRSLLGVPPENRWAGANRYETALTIAKAAIAKGWLNYTYIGFAAKLPDALVGGSMIGYRHGILLLTPPTMTNASVMAYLDSQSGLSPYAFAYGGTGAIAESVRVSLQSAMN